MEEQSGDEEGTSSPEKAAGGKKKDDGHQFGRKSFRECLLSYLKKKRP